MAAFLTKNRGIALAATLIILVMLGILVSGMLVLSSSQIDLQATRHESTQALYLAEAGINKVIYQWAASSKDAPTGQTGSLGDGSYVAVIGSAQPSAGAYTVTSTGTVGTGGRAVSRKVRVTIQRPSTELWNHVVLSTSYLTSGHPDVTGGTHGPMQVPADRIPKPDLEQYRNIADYYVDDDLNISGQRKLSGVYYVHGSVNISGKVELSGSFIATGSINISGNSKVTIVPQDDVYYPALVAQGMISLSGNNTTITGVVWAGLTVAISAGNINGAIVSPTVILSGTSAGASYGADILGQTYMPVQNPPPYFSGGSGKVLVPGSWQEVPL